MIMHYNIKRRC